MSEWLILATKEIRRELGFFFTDSLQNGTNKRISFLLTKFRLAELYDVIVGKLAFAVM